MVRVRIAAMTDWQCGRRGGWCSELDGVERPSGCTTIRRRRVFAGVKTLSSRHTHGKGVCGYRLLHKGVGKAILHPSYCSG